MRRVRMWLCRCAGLGMLGAVLTAGACETTEGAGRDLERGGEAIQDAAN